MYSEEYSPEYASASRSSTVKQGLVRAQVVRGWASTTSWDYRVLVDRIGRHLGLSRPEGLEEMDGGSEERVVSRPMTWLCAVCGKPNTFWRSKCDRCGHTCR